MLHCGARVGGLCGQAVGSGEFSLIDCFSSARVGGVSLVGGLVGRLGSGDLIQRSYFLGTFVNIENNYGALCYAVDSDSAFSYSYWSSELSGISEAEDAAESNNETNKQISALVKQSTYSTWDFANVWAIDEGTSLPYLRCFDKPSCVTDVIANYPIMEGLGTSTSPYIINIVAQLQKVQYELSGYYKLGADINLSTVSSWTPIGTKDVPFTGSFDGNGCTISNIKISSSDTLEEYIGFFGYTEGATISNLTLKNYSITEGYADYIGGLIGYMRGGTTTNVSANGTIYQTSSTTSTYIGGLIGGVYSNSTVGKSYIKQCSTQGTITANKGYRVGGLIGDTNGASSYNIYVQNCYSTMKIDGYTYIGGLLGYATYTSVLNSYAIGSVVGDTSNVGGLAGNAGSTCSASSSYWNTETTGQAESELAEDGGKTTTQMQTASTYSGWDTSIWNIVDGAYPTLK